MQTSIYNSFDDAVIARIVSRWNDASSKPIGRTIIQKLCYFIKAKGVPLRFDFDIHHYGPYSSDLYKRMDELVVDGVVNDKCHGCKSEYEPGNISGPVIDKYASELEAVSEDIDLIINTFSRFNPRSMELFATIHYMNSSYYRFYKLNPSKEQVIEMVERVKGPKFQKQTIANAYDALNSAGLFEWVN